MEALPLTVDLHGRLVVVVGGGSAAGSAVRLLLSAGSLVLVVAPQLSASLAGLAAKGTICARNRPYQASDLDGAWLVLACGPDEVNARVSADAGERQTWAASWPARGSDAARLGDAVLDDAVLDDAGLDEPGSAPAPGKRVLVLGGARSGKSAAAESMLADAAAAVYVATGQLAGEGDAEWDRRVGDHQARRPPGWKTLETSAVAEVLTDQGGGTPVLIDCLSTWLAQVMDDCGLWSGAPDADVRLRERADELVAAWQQSTRTVIAVSNEVGSGVVPATPSGRRYRDELGWLNSRIARASEEVWLCTAGIPHRLR
ncbi:MAG TPA: bifunctional adenosylcobinamide kinase/adenosylcobinamide-phosphate guanylyltransferase [Streptosporangiaceae bacterium]|nr:bifunctional adenosylcobinamide kinase/adenosylcobinamide-phosphate guanylyltransferase [Streptosporangiaceae bacterium]